jgi:hypothetical protein
VAVVEDMMLVDKQVIQFPLLVGEVLEEQI